MAASDHNSKKQFGRFSVHTKHGEDRKERVSYFPDFDSALAHAESTDPDKDASMVPNGGEDFKTRPGYQAGVFYSNTDHRYAAIIDNEPPSDDDTPFWVR